MGGHAGPADWWTDGTQAGREYIASNGIVQTDLALFLDAANTNSYSGSGTTWYDLSGNNANAIAVDMPTHVSNGGASYFQFDGVQNEFNSDNVTQNYVDMFALIRLETTALSMLFGMYDNLDASVRFSGGYMRDDTTTTPGGGQMNVDDWALNEDHLIFHNGVFGPGQVYILNNWAFIRQFRSNTSEFGTNGFRYEISSSFLSDARHFQGKVNCIGAYTRQLTNQEVLQNYGALKSRFGL